MYTCRCRKEKGDLVCGDNGVTYISLCHAMNCGELKKEEVKPGACETKVCWVDRNWHAYMYMYIYMYIMSLI